jgi:hypothetical protein
MVMRGYLKIPEEEKSKHLLICPNPMQSKSCLIPMERIYVLPSTNENIHSIVTTSLHFFIFAHLHKYNSEGYSLSALL